MLPPNEAQNDQWVYEWHLNLKISYNMCRCCIFSFSSLVAFQYYGAQSRHLLHISLPRGVLSLNGNTRALLNITCLFLNCMPWQLSCQFKLRSHSVISSSTFLFWCLLQERAVNRQSWHPAVECDLYCNIFPLAGPDNMQYNKCGFLLAKHYCLCLWPLIMAWTKYKQNAMPTKLRTGTYNQLQTDWHLFYYMWFND